MKARIFVASSAERLDLAYAAQENLEHQLEVTVWSQGVFGLSRSTMASLVDELDQTDFGLFILAPDDVTALRGKEVATPRDNVIFELGLFMGRLGPERCFMFVPRGAEDLHLPSDLLGLSSAEYDPDRQDDNLAAALGPGCNRVTRAAAKLGRLKPDASTIEVEDAGGDLTLYSDKEDCVALIQSWMGSRPSAANSKAINYSEVDRELRLVPGSAQNYIAEAAKRYGYEPDRQGRDFVLFRKPPAVRRVRHTF